MNTFINFMENKFVPITNKISGNKYLKTISEGSMSMLGIIMVGAIFSIFNNLSWEPYVNFMQTTGLKEIVSWVPQVTTELSALYMAFIVGYNGSKNFDNEGYTLSSGILSLVCFMLLIPINSTDVEGISFIDVSYLGTRGLFVALIVGVVVARLFAAIIARDIRIKLPDGVPPMVGESFSSLISCTILVVLFIAIKYVFSLTPYGTANSFIYSIIQTPLQNLTGSLPAFIICLLIAQLLWFFGVHGSFTVLPIFMPIWMGYIGENTAALAAGKAIPHVLNVAFWDLANLGGAGATIGLVILMAFTAKSQQYKQFGKITLPCGIFNVNEPVIFGLPMILNPIMLFPFVLAPIVIVVLAYALVQIGIIAAPLGTFGAGSLPPFIGGLFQGSVSWGVYQVVAIFISIGIYYPFFKIVDKQAYKKEQGELDAK